MLSHSLEHIASHLENTIMHRLLISGLDFPVYTSSQRLATSCASHLALVQCHMTVHQDESNALAWKLWLFVGCHVFDGLRVEEHQVSSRTFGDKAPERVHRESLRWARREMSDHGRERDQRQIA